jgi:hypothetical protein
VLVPTETGLPSSNIQGTKRGGDSVRQPAPTRPSRRGVQHWVRAAGHKSDDRQEEIPLAMTCRRQQAGHGPQEPHGGRPTCQSRDQRRGRSGSVEILLELMANGADSDNVATHFKCGNEPGVSEGNDELTLLVVEGASGLAA